MHTDNFRNGFWTRNGPRKRGDTTLPIVQRGDILVARVGRNCSKTFSKFIGLEGFNLTDCVYCIRSKNSVESLEILFAIKVLMNFSWSGYILERGTGATYMSKSDLESLEIPIKLAEEWPDQFADFKQAISRRNHDSCQSAIEETCQALAPNLSNFK